MSESLLCEEPKKSREQALIFMVFAAAQAAQKYNIRVQTGRSLFASAPLPSAWPTLYR